MFGGSLGIHLPQQPWKPRIGLLNFFFTFYQLRVIHVFFPHYGSLEAY